MSERALTKMNKTDLQREMEWAFAKILFAAKELKYSGFFPPDGVSPFRDGASDANVRDWVRNDAGAMMVVKTLASRAMDLVDSYIKGTDTCENCGQLMQRSYPLGLPLGVYVLCCAGCGTNMNYVANPDMRYTETLYAKDSPAPVSADGERPASPSVDKS